MNRIGREMTEYLALSVLKTIALVWLVLLGFDLINAFYNSFSDVGKNGFTLNYALLSTLFTTPRPVAPLVKVSPKGRMAKPPNCIIVPNQI